MVSLTVVYRLSEGGQRELVRSGYDAPRTGTLVIEPDDDAWVPLVDRASIDEAGDALLDLTQKWNPSRRWGAGADVLFDRIPGCGGDVLDRLVQVEAELARVDAEARARDEELKAAEAARQVEERARVWARLFADLEEAKSAHPELAAVLDDLESTAVVVRTDPGADPSRLAAELDGHRHRAQAAGERAEAVAWVAAHGSSRLQRIVDAGLLDASWAVYRDERLAVERPGWVWESDVPGALAQVRNPSEAALDLLDLACSTAPDAALWWLRIDASEPEGPWAGVIARAQHQDRRINLLPPDLHAVLRPTDHTGTNADH